MSRKLTRVDPVAATTLPSTEELKRLLADARLHPSGRQSPALAELRSHAIDLARKVVRLQNKIERIEQITDTHSEMNGAALNAISRTCKEP